MASSVFWAVCVLLTALVVYYGFLVQPPQPPPMADGWFGAGPKPKPDNKEITKFTVNVTDKILKDLKARLENSRLSEDLEESTFEYGMQSDILRSTLLYWMNQYNWRKHEAIINSFNQYNTQIEGLMVHFIHVKSKHKTAKPLLLLHGWPGSVWEFYKLIPMLTDPTNHGGTEKDAFHVIAPSIPGYGWSEAPHHRGFDVVAAARVFHKLMMRTGNHQYYVQGGDWGSMIGTVLAMAYPKEVKGLHLNMFSPPLNSMRAVLLQLICPLWPSLFLNEKETWKCRPMSEKFMNLLQETGYFHIQATKPDTVGVGLNDSPIGLAAYILEKFSTWCSSSKPEGNVKRQDGNLYKKFTIDELLTNVMIYWVNGNIKSSVRFYKEFFRGNAVNKTGWDFVPVTVPTGLASFPGEMIPPPEFLVADKYTNIVQYTDMPRGGHFAALEEPALLAQDIRNFVAKVEQS